MKCQVLIVEDQAMPRQLFEIFVDSSEKFNRVGSITNADLALPFCKSTKVDLILMDVCTALNASGLDAAESIKKQLPDIRIIIVTSMPEFSWISRARSIGVDSFWYKDADRQAILSIMERTMAGESVYPDETPDVAIGLSSSHEFTDRELDVLKKLTTGASNAEIGDQLCISTSTVKRHVENMLIKTGFRTRTELVSEAVRLGIALPYQN
ncbi:MAG: response regulator transcription factor [Eubacteriales bacterium]|nr:response regulator transcription factor [Eubacteriales bacterium]